MRRTIIFAAAAELAKQISEDDCRDEPSFKHLFDIASGEETINQDQIAGYYYRPDAHLMNHCDSDQILFTMSVAPGDDCDFVIGKTTSRSARMSERSGKEFNIRIKSGDALFFDGGLVPHQVKRVSKNNVIAGTAPRWWMDANVANGSRCVVVFRERGQDFYKNRLLKKHPQ